GTFQFVGVEVDKSYVLYYLRSVVEKPPRWWKLLISPALRIVARIAAIYFRNAAVFATIVEDLPYWDNCVVPDPRADNGMRFEYRYTDELSKRNRMLRRELSTTLKPNHRI